MIKNFLAYDLALELHRKTATLRLKASLKDQLDRATESIVLNLAEGSGKPSQRDKKRFYAIAFGSLREVQAIFDLIAIQDQATKDTAHRLGGMLYKIVYRSSS